MQTFNLKKFTDEEYVAGSLKDLEDLYKAIQNDETLILSCEGKAEIIIGSDVKPKIILGSIILKAEFEVN
jgi:hypothetical protein